MALSTGELSGLAGVIVMMTATATPKTLRVLQNQFPEISKWKNLLNLPLRENVTVIVPPTDLISSNVEITLTPFIHDMKEHQRVYLIIVRGKITWFKCLLHFIFVYYSFCQSCCKFQFKLNCDSISLYNSVPHK